MQEAAKLWNVRTEKKTNMTAKRYNELNGPEEHKLTQDEIKEGWHFCYEFDGLCRNSNEEDFKCKCNEFQNQPKKGNKTP